MEGLALHISVRLCSGKPGGSGMRKIIGHRQGVGARGQHGAMWVLRSLVMENSVSPA